MGYKSLFVVARYSVNTNTLRKSHVATSTVDVLY